MRGENTLLNSRYHAKVFLMICVLLAVFAMCSPAKDFFFIIFKFNLISFL